MIIVIVELNCIVRCRDYMFLRELEIVYICYILIYDVFFFDFKDKIGSVCYFIFDDEVFLYIRFYFSGGKGEVDISYGY